MHIAAERGFSDIVEYLVDKVKVDVNFRAKVRVNETFCSISFARTHNMYKESLPRKLLNYLF